MTCFKNLIIHFVSPTEKDKMSNRLKYTVPKLANIFIYYLWENHFCNLYGQLSVFLFTSFSASLFLGLLCCFGKEIFNSFFQKGEWDVNFWSPGVSKNIFIFFSCLINCLAEFRGMLKTLLHCFLFFSHLASSIAAEESKAIWLLFLFFFVCDLAFPL